MTAKIKGLVSFVLRFGFSGLLLWWLFSKIDTQKTVQVLKNADPLFIVLTIIVFFINNCLLVWRWLVFIGALDLKVKPSEAVRYYLIGLFGNLFLPSAVGGDIIKAVGLCKNSDQKPRVVASILLDRLSGFAGLVLLAVFTYCAGYGLINDPGLIKFIVILAIGPVTMAFILFNEKIFPFGCRVFGFWPKLKDALITMHDDIQLLKGRKKDGFFAIFLSVLGQSVFSICFFLIAKALHQDVSFIYFLIFVPMICVLSSLPSIGGLGVREVGAVYLFSRIGIDEGVSVSISLMVFLLMVLIGLIGGLYYVTTIPSGRVQSDSQDAADQPVKA